MREAAELISLGIRRSQPDHHAIRIAHYTGYPRVSRDQRECTAIARGETSNELSLIALEREEVGALLRLEVNDLRGAPGRETLARVVSCSEHGEGHFELRVAPVVPKAARFVRRTPEAMRLEG